MVVSKEIIMAKPTAQDRQWQAESDARTLADADVIKETPTRMSAARGVAKKLAEESQKQADGMKKVARKK